MLLCAARCFVVVTALLLLCKRVAVWSPSSPFCVFCSLPAEKGLVLLNHSAHRLAPLVVIVRGAQLFWGFLAVVFCALRPFSRAEAVYSRSDAEYPCRSASFSVGSGGASLALMLAFAPSCRTSRYFALRFRVFASSVRAVFTASHPFVAGR